jgi:hypothetical protein
MMHVTFADKSLLIGDEIAELLLEYATAIADRGRADQVTIRAIGSDGNEVDVHLLLDSGTIIAAESTNSTANPPDNRDNIEDIRRRIDRLVTPPSLHESAVQIGDRQWLDEF